MEEANNHEDVARLFAAERVPMVHLATLLVGSPAVAEELVQDAFVAVTTRWDRLDRPGAYLRTSVVNKCTSALRRRAIENRYRASVSPESDYGIPEQLIELRDALARLSDRQRVVVVLRYFADMPDADIAETLGVRPATVRSLAHRAMAVLRKELE